MGVDTPQQPAPLALSSSPHSGVAGQRLQLTSRDTYGTHTRSPRPGRSGKAAPPEDPWDCPRRRGEKSVGYRKHVTQDAKNQARSGRENGRLPRRVGRLRPRGQTVRCGPFVAQTVENRAAERRDSVTEKVSTKPLPAICLHPTTPACEARGDSNPGSFAPRPLGTTLEPARGDVQRTAAKTAGRNRSPALNRNALRYAAMHERDMVRRGSTVRVRQRAS
jgi:hypothetical protein